MSLRCDKWCDAFHSRAAGVHHGRSLHHAHSAHHVPQGTHHSKKSLSSVDKRDFFVAEWEGFEPSRGFKTAYSLSRGITALVSRILFHQIRCFCSVFSKNPKFCEYLARISPQHYYYTKYHISTESQGIFFLFLRQAKRILVLDALFLFIRSSSQSECQSRTQ